MNTVVTIGRQFGSAGREIGEKVAEKLGIKCYDKELIARAAKDSGLCEEVLEHHDERPTSSFLYNLVMDTYSFGYNASTFVDMPISQKVFLAQFESIKKLADKGPCIIVGRCADYALADYDNCLKVFFHADMDYRIARIASKYDVTPDKARDMIQKKDKSRSSYYNYYSSKKWGYAETYDASISTSAIGIDGAVEMLIHYIELFEKNRT